MISTRTEVAYALVLKYNAFRRRYLSLISARQQRNFVSRLGIYMPLFHVLTAAVDDVESIGLPRRVVGDFSRGVFDRKIAASFGIAGRAYPPGGVPQRVFTDVQSIARRIHFDRRLLFCPRSSTDQ